MGDTYSPFFIVKKKKKLKSTPYLKKMFFFLCPLQNVTQMKENFLTVIGDGDATNICSGLLNTKQKLHCSRYPEEFWPHMKTNYKLLYAALS